MNQYFVNKVEQNDYVIADSNNAEHKLLWATVPAAQINCYPWDENGYKPEGNAKMVHDEEAFYVHLEAKEHLDCMRTSCTKHNEEIYEDSCMELFLMPDPLHQDLYMNFEFNSAGCLLLAIGKNRHNRKRIFDGIESLHIRTSSQIITEPGIECCLWTVEFRIPFSFLKEHFGPIAFHSGGSLRTNFYKCGDKTPKPHYGCWNPIGTENPEFHLSSTFGELILA